MYPWKGFKPLVIESYRAKIHQGTEYKRRLRINRMNAQLIDDQLGTHLRENSFQTRFIVLDLEDIKKACTILEIDFKPINTYFCIDSKMESFSQVPWFLNKLRVK